MAANRACACSGSHSGGRTADDWFGGFDALHHRTAVWAAALAGVTVIRATGHGISSIIDGAGRVLARASSRTGEPVVLIADAPLAAAPR